MAVIQVKPLYNGEIYRPNGNFPFNSKDVWDYIKALQNRYESFADKINAQNGYIELNLSHNEMPNGIHFEAFVKGISKELNDEIEQAIPSDY